MRWRHGWRAARLRHISPFGLTYAIVSAIARREAEVVAEGSSGLRRVGGVRRPTVRGRCYRRPEGAATSTDAGCAQAIVRPGDDCRRLKQCLTTPGTHA